MLCTLLCTSFFISVSLSCFGGHGRPKHSSGKGKKGKAIDKKWGGWDPPKDVEKRMQQWLENYKASVKNSEYWDTMDPEKRKEWEEERNKYGNWPESWKDMGPGQGGVDPPLTAYVPKNMGKPAECYMPADKGTCKSPGQRWGYNPYVDECKQFPYSGCGGNENNFATKLLCVDKCMSPPKEDCEQDSHIYIDETMWA